ncbi:MAG TPA: AAA family ATPase [Leptospiraceae bacterium]|nr:AAA family ATPase [Leptospiraceae bacterium]HMZ58098.1 AAA family ATPase [Leptospiraceae bacterium]
MQPLPIGIQTFKNIREGDFLYVDKTKWIYELVRNPNAVYFLSRPRRFGKSLTLSTLKEIFEGNRELFQGLWIYNADYHWKKYPIIRIDFSKQKAESKEELKRFILEQLDYNAESYGVQLTKKEYFSRFEELIKAISKKDKIVILIDEYDKPIIDHLTKPELAIEMREILKGFYTIIKASDEYLRFVLLTGVSKFSKTGVFSGLNNLNDISMSLRYSAIAGITEEELKNNFKEYTAEFSNTVKISEDELLQKIRHWYNGYCFSGQCEKVYNPFSTLLLFENKEFKNYWFETGTPSFLIDLAKEKDFAISELPILAEETSFSTYEVDELDVIPLLFQTGYLTLKGYDPERLLYTLDYPNFEVKNAFLQQFTRRYTNRVFQESKLYGLIDSLRERDFENFFLVLRSIFANIDYDLHIPAEKYYQTIFYLIFTLIGLRVSAEVKTNIGRIDAVIEDRGGIFLFEFKFSGTKEEALAQIRKNKYFEKYLSPAVTHGQTALQREIYLFGVEFSDKNAGEWVMEKMTG